MSVMDEVMAVFAQRGSGAYFGESVSMTDHMLQTAYFARAESAAAPLILAALLHDVGHLVESVPDDLEDWVEDAHHEEIGAQPRSRGSRPKISTKMRCASGAGTITARWRGS